MRTALPRAAETRPLARGYFTIRFTFFLAGLVTSGGGLAAARAASSASLAWRRARRRSMFLRIVAALRSTSAMARAPSSAAMRWRLARAMLSGEGSFFSAILDPGFARAKARSRHQD